MNVNLVVFAGRLTRDPQLKYLPSQSAVCEFGIVANRRYRSGDGQDREESTFVEVAAFGKQAELINTHFRKGKEILVEGRLKFDSWEDKNGGGKRSKLSIVVEKMQFVGAASAADRKDQASSGAPRKPADPTDPPPINEDDIPF